MKKLLLALFLSCSLMSLQAQVVENRKMKTETLSSVEQRTGKGHYWSLEGNAIHIFAVVSCNGVWEYKFNNWFKLGAGAGVGAGFLYSMLYSDWFGINGFGRVGFDIPTKSNVYPFITMDLCGSVSFGELAPNLHYAVQSTIGIAIKQRYNEGKILVGLTLNMMGSEDADYLTYFPLPGLKVGYTF